MGRWCLGGIAALSKSALLSTPCERLFNALAIETVRADRKRYANDFSALRELVFGPEALTDVYHRLVALELLHGAPEFSPGASMEALTKPAFRLH